MHLYSSPDSSYCFAFFLMSQYNFYSFLSLSHSILLSQYFSKLLGLAPLMVIAYRLNSYKSAYSMTWMWITCCLFPQFMIQLYIIRNLFPDGQMILPPILFCNISLWKYPSEYVRNGYSEITWTCKKKLLKFFTKVSFLFYCPLSTP